MTPLYDCGAWLLLLLLEGRLRDEMEEEVEEEEMAELDGISPPCPLTGVDDYRLNEGIVLYPPMFIE